MLILVLLNGAQTVVSGDFTNETDIRSKKAKLYYKNKNLNLMSRMFFCAPKRMNCFGFHDPMVSGKEKYISSLGNAQGIVTE